MHFSSHYFFLSHGLIFDLIISTNKMNENVQLRNRSFPNFPNTCIVSVNTKIEADYVTHLLYAVTLD